MCLAHELYKINAQMQRTTTPIKPATSIHQQILAPPLLHPVVAINDAKIDVKTDANI